MRVSVNPERVAADLAFRVRHPDSRRFFPVDPFEMSASDWDNPRVRRLFPPSNQVGGVEGGLFGDLILITGAVTTNQDA